MQYPLISEYAEAILNAEDNFATLTNLRPVLDGNSSPIMSSGNFAVVFKMTDGEKFYAVKCFTREQDGRSKAYKSIAEHISQLKSKYFTTIKYLEYELFVDANSTNETEFPILLMEWVEGLTLDKYIDEYKGNPFVLHNLCVSFAELCKWLCSQNIAHGDLKPDNIIIRPTGDIVLIDYDGMFLPTMEGEDAREMGSTNYRLPSRNIRDFNRYIDDFALAAISLNLKAISVIYGISDEYNCSENFLFSEKDYICPKQSVILQRLLDYSYQDASLAPYISTFLLALNKIQLLSSHFDFGDVRVSNLLHTDFNEKYYTSNIENGLVYSLDGRRLLSFDYEFNNDDEIHVREGCICICEEAFDSYKANRKLNIFLPKSLRFFTKESFAHNYKSLHWQSPWFVYDDGCIYSKDFSSLILQHLANVKLNTHLKIIERNCFHGLDCTDIVLPNSVRVIRKDAFHLASIKDTLILPDDIQVIEDEAFRSCDNLKAIQFGRRLIFLGKHSFNMCDELEAIYFPKDCLLKDIGEWAFSNCKNLRTVKFHGNLRKIGKGAFIDCKKLQEIALPDKTEIIEDSAFKNLNSSDENNVNDQIQQSTFIIPKTVQAIGESAFRGARFIKEMYICGNPKIKDSAFADCPNLIDVQAPQLLRVSVSMFTNSYNLKSITIDNVYIVESQAFEGCKQLQFIMPKAIEEIDYGALNGVGSVLTNENFVYEDNILYDKDRRTIISFNKKTDRIRIKEGVETINSKAFFYIPEIIELPNSILDQSIMEILHLETRYVKLPKGKGADFKIGNYGEGYYRGKYISVNANAVGEDSAYIDEFGVTYSEDLKKLINFPYSLPLEEYTVNSACEEIADYAFTDWVDPDPEFGTSYGGNKLKLLNFPIGLKRIGICALAGCRGLSQITLPNSLVTLDYGALSGCVGLWSLRLPKSLKNIGESALPEELWKLQCDSSYFKIYDGCLLSDKDVLWIQSGIEELKLPDIINFKGYCCKTYPNCIVSTDGILLWTTPNIEHFEFPTDIKIIGEGAFANNRRIKKIVIPEGVTTIRCSAFCCNQALTSISLPSTMREIGDLKTRQGWGRKYIKYFYPKEIHVPKGMKGHFYKLLPDIPDNQLIDDVDNIDSKI